MENDDHYQKFISAGTANKYNYRKHVNYKLPQPLAAWTGLTGCFLLIIVSSSVWWDNRSHVSKAWSVSVFFLVSLLIYHMILRVMSVRIANSKLGGDHASLLACTQGLERDLEDWVDQYK